ncbi:MAG TPA: sulfatase [Candidatus Krumholzibacteria bacterium]
MRYSGGMGILRHIAVFGCSLALLAACSPEKGRESERDLPDDASRPNILLVVLDTVRADRLGAYGDARAQTPNLDAFAHAATLFENCMSSSCWTLPAHASLFTGMLPIAHQATQETLRLSDKFPTLAEIFAAHGYSVYGASANAVVSRTNGLDRGFPHFEELYRSEVENSHRLPGRHPHDVALEKWLSGREDDRPFFAFLNFIEAHTPYWPPEPFLSRALLPQWTLQQGRAASLQKTRDHYLLPEGLSDETIHIMSRLYDGEIAYLDWAFGKLAEMLEAHGFLDDTLIVVTSDHGEQFGEHDLVSHSFSLYEPLIDIPLMVRWPDGRNAGTRRADPVHLMDLFPSLLKVAGIRPAAAIHGVDIFTGPADGDRIRVAEYYYPRQMFSMLDPALVATNLNRLAPFMQRLRAFRQGSQKFIWSSDGRHELFELSNDPGESHSVFEGENGALWKFNERFAERFAEGADLTPVPPKGWAGGGFEENTDDLELLERLRALGYVD